MNITGGQLEQVIYSFPEINDRAFVESLLKVVTESPLSYLSQPIQGALDFEKEMGHFPDPGYLWGNFPVFETQSGQAVSKDTALAAYRNVAKLSIQQRAIASLTQGEFDDAKTALSELDIQEQQVVQEYTLDDAIQYYLDTKDQEMGVPLGISEIDQLIKGFSYGTSNVIAAGPGNFKTTTAISIMYNNCVKNDKTFAYVNLEGMKSHWWFNMVARHSLEMGKPLSAEGMKKGLLTEADIEVFKEVGTDLSNKIKAKEARIKLIGSEDLVPFSYLKLDALWRQIVEEFGDLDGIIWDHIQLAKYLRPDKREPIEEFVNGLILYLTHLAINFKNNRGLVSIILSQINREGIKFLTSKRKGFIGHFSEFNELERSITAGLVMYATSAEKLANQVGISVVKNRFGKTQDELEYVYVDPDHMVVGSKEFINIFNMNNLNLLGKEKDLVGDEEIFT